MIVVAILGIAWAVACIGTILFGPLWPLLVFITVALVIGLIGVTFRSLDYAFLGPFGSTGVFGVTILALQHTSDPLAKTFADNYWRLGWGVLILLLIVTGVITNNLQRTEWGRHYEGRLTIRELTEIIQDVTSEERAAAVLSLSGDNYNGRKSLAVIIQATHDADPAVHEMAMLALLDNSDARFEPISQAIEADGEPRHVATANLELTPFAERVGLLLAYATPRAKPAAYQYAFNVLTELGPDVIPVLLKDLEPPGDDAPKILVSFRRQHAAHVLGQLDLDSFADATVTALINALEDSDADTREEIITALGRIGDSRATISLVSQLHDKDTNVRTAALDALGELGDASALPALQALRDDYARDRQKRLLLLVADEAIARIQARARE